MADDQKDQPGQAPDAAAYHPSYDPAGEVVELCRDLIRIDTTNYGDESGPGERKAAEHVAALLDEVGIEVELHESEPGRASLLARWGGTPFRQAAFPPLRRAVSSPTRCDCAIRSGFPVTRSPKCRWSS